MDWTFATQIFISAIIAISLLFDLLALNYGGYQATISCQISTICSRYPVVALLLGILLGHLFWPIDAYK